MTGSAKGRKGFSARLWAGPRPSRQPHHPRPVHSRAAIARAQPCQGNHPEAIVEAGYGTQV